MRRGFAVAALTFVASFALASCDRTSNETPVEIDVDFDTTKTKTVTVPAPPMTFIPTTTKQPPIKVTTRPATPKRTP